MARRPATPARRPSESADDKIVAEAKKRFNRCETWEANARVRWLEDEKFVNGDSDNLYQWPQALQEARGYGTGDERPCLTINKTRQHVLQIINDARQNKTHIKFRPVGGGATYDAAQILDGIVRHVEYISDAQSAYGTAIRHQVQSGMGYLRVVTDYAGPDTFEQEIYIRRVKNPLTIYIDPDIQEADGSDMRFGFVFNDVPRDEFELKHPDLKGDLSAPLGNPSDAWNTKDHVREAEYWRVREKKDTLVVLKDPETGEEKLFRASKVPAVLKPMLAELLEDPTAQKREVIDKQVEWFKIAGHKIIERGEWAGRYIPIIRVPGEETVIDGEMDRKGHVRALKDPQRMYNYNASAQVEFGALQSKIPYVASASAIEGYENYWQNANLENFSVLVHNDRDDEGREIKAPQRQTPPVVATAYQVSMENAANDMMLVSGQYQADFGAPSNERSGKAIEARQRQGSTATYHYIDHAAMALRFVGRIILDLVPKVYDTRRVIKIMAEDGSDSDVVLDPKAAEAYLEKQQQDASKAKQVIFNPNVGRYDVESDVGPDYATRRQEAFNALSQIAGSNQELMLLVGDLLFKSADFEYADQIAQRLERLVPAAAKGDDTGPSPEVQQLQANLQAMGKLIETLSQKLQEKQLALADKTAKIAEGAEQKVIDVYKAETDRLAVFKDFLAADPEAAVVLMRQLLADTMQTDITPGSPAIGIAAE